MFTDRITGGLAAVAAVFLAVVAVPGAGHARDEAVHPVKGRLDGVKVEVTGVTIGQADYTRPGTDTFVPTTDDYLKVALRITNTGAQPLYIQKYWTDTSCQDASKQVHRLHDMASVLLVDVKGDVFNVEVAPGDAVDDLLLFRDFDRAAPPSKRLTVAAKAPLFRQPGMVRLAHDEIRIDIDASAITVEPRRDPPAPTARASGGGTPAPEAEALSPEDALLAERLKPLFAVEPKVKDGVVTLDYAFVDAAELGDFLVGNPELTGIDGGLSIKKIGKVATKARFGAVEMRFTATFDYLSGGTSSFTVTLAEDEPGDFVGSQFGVQAISVRDKRVKRSHPRRIAPAKLFRVQRDYEFVVRFDGESVAGELDGQPTGRLEKLKDYETGRIGFELSETNVTIRRLVITGTVDPEWLGRQPAAGDGVSGG